VSRYDGKTIRNFTTSPFDSTSLNENDGRYVVADHKGGVWVSVQNRGLDYFDPALDGFRHYGEEKGVRGRRFNEVAVGVDGEVWALAPNSILKLNESSDRFELAFDLEDFDTYNVQAASNGSLYFSTLPDNARSWEEFKIGILSPDGSVRYVVFPDIIPVNGVDDIRFAVSDQLELVLLAGENVAVLTPEKEWRLISNINPDCLIKAEDAEFDDGGKLWVNAVSAVCQIDLATGAAVVHQNNPTNPNSILLSAANENGVFIDRQGIVWATRWGNGISRLDPSATQFDVLASDIELPPGNVMAALENEDGSFWVGMRDVSPNTLVLMQPDRTYRTVAGSNSLALFPAFRKPLAWLIHLSGTWKNLLTALFGQPQPVQAEVA